MIGDFTAGKTVIVRFNTHQADGTPITLAGTPAISVYKNSTTESTTGVSLTVDYDGRTGLHHVAVDTSADGTFYAAGNDFDLIITTGTVDSISVVGTKVGSFSLANRAALRPTTADRTLDVSSGGEAGLDWSNIGSPTTTVNLSGTTVKTATDVETDTADIQSRLPAALTGDGNIKADTLYLGGTLQTGRDIGSSVLLSSGTGTGQVKLASGYVAPNWGDVGNPTTTVNLSGTTVKTATDVETDTVDIQSRLPAALTGDGNIKADALAIADGILTSAKFTIGSLDANASGLVELIVLAARFLLKPSDQTKQVGMTPAELTMYEDDGTTPLVKITVYDDGTTFAKSGITAP